MFSKRSMLALFLPLVLIGMLVAACGSSTPTTTGSGGTTPTAAPTATPTPTTASSGSSAVVATASATVQGKSVTILTNEKGMTLYYNTKDSATSVSCTGGCATAWPPLIFGGSGTPSSSSSLPGTLTVYNGADGAQVEYQGHPLYTYVSDTAPGQTNGENAGGVWFVATTDLAANASGGSGSGY